MRLAVFRHSLKMLYRNLSGGVTAAEAGSYPAVSPLPVFQQAVYFLLRCLSKNTAKGGAFLPGITRHHALRSPDFPHPAAENGGRMRRFGSPLKNHSRLSQNFSFWDNFLKKRSFAGL